MYCKGEVKRRLLIPLIDDKHAMTSKGAAAKVATSYELAMKFWNLSILESVFQLLVIIQARTG